MNFFEFLYSTIEFASQNFGAFIVTFIILLLVGIISIALTSSIAGFRLFTINKQSKTINEKLPKLTPNPNNNTEHQNTIYDLLVDAYDRYKEKKKNKGSDNTGNDI